MDLVFFDGTRNWQLPPATFVPRWISPALILRSEISRGDPGKQPEHDAFVKASDRACIDLQIHVSQFYRAEETSFLWIFLLCGRTKERGNCRSEEDCFSQVLRNKVWEYSCACVWMYEKRFESILIRFIFIYFYSLLYIYIFYYYYYYINHVGLKFCLILFPAVSYLSNEPQRILDFTMLVETFCEYLVRVTLCTRLSLQKGHRTWISLTARTFFFHWW